MASAGEGRAGSLDAYLGASVRVYEMEAAISGVGHCALQARPLHVAAIITPSCARNVNPRSDQLILE